MALRPRVISVATMRAMKERPISHTLMESVSRVTFGGCLHPRGTAPPGMADEDPDLVK